MTDKCVVLLSFIEQTQNNSKNTVAIMFNIYNPFNVFVYKKRHLINMGHFW